MFDDDFILTPAEALDFAKHGKVMLVDIREPHEWEKTGVAPNAHLLAMNDPEFMTQIEMLKQNHPASKIAVICAAGGRSTRLQQALTQMGWREVYNVLEGMSGGQFGKGWVAGGLPIVPYEANKQNIA